MLSKPGQERFADWGYRPVNEEVLAANKSKFPEPARPLHDRGPRRLAEGQRRVLRPREGLDRQDRGGRRGCRPPSERRAPHRRAGAPRAGVPSGALALGVVDAVAQPHRAAAAGRRRRAVARRRPRRVLGRGHRRGRRSPRCASPCSSRSPRRRSTPSAGTLIAWVLVRDQLPRQARRQRADRPAVRAADDRRRPHAARALRAEQPDRHQRRVDAVGGAAGAAVRDAAVRDPLGAAGADRARPGDGGGGASLGARAATIFRRIVLPNLVPAILSGAALAFARAVGEFGSIVLISGNIPFDTQVARSSSTSRSRATRRSAPPPSRSCCCCVSLAGAGRRSAGSALGGSP